MAAPDVTPMPPVATGLVLPWHGECPDPVAAIGAARAECGDTFVVDSGRDRYLFTFSPVGVESFYALSEDAASKGLADYLMLRRKLPDEIFAGRRTLPSQLFRRGDVAMLLAGLDRALDATAVGLGTSGAIDVFELTRSIGHRMGFAAWAPPGATDEPVFGRLVHAFDALDGADAFVHPDAMAAIEASGKAAERAALAEIVELIGEGIDDVDPAERLFGRIAQAWDGEPTDARRIGIAYDIALIHVASMSNLASALGWLLVDLLTHSEAPARVSAGDREFAQLCALESTRLAQRSIMSRYVCAPVTLDTGEQSYAVSPGVTIATLLPLLNTSAGPGLERWDPERWDRYRLADVAPLASPQLVTAFGHGRHTCPAQPFSLAAMSTAVLRLFERFELRADWTEHPSPVPAQIGGVARAAGAVPMTYRRRA